MALNLFSCPNRHKSQADTLGIWGSLKHILTSKRLLIFERFLENLFRNLHHIENPNLDSIQHPFSMPQLQSFNLPHFSFQHSIKFAAPSSLNGIEIPPIIPIWN